MGGSARSRRSRSTDDESRKPTRQMPTRALSTTGRDSFALLVAVHSPPSRGNQIGNDLGAGLLIHFRHHAVHAQTAGHLTGSEERGGCKSLGRLSVIPNQRSSFAIRCGLGRAQRAFACEARVAEGERADRLGGKGGRLISRGARNEGTVRFRKSAVVVQEQNPSTPRSRSGCDSRSPLRRSITPSFIAALLGKEGAPHKRGRDSSTLSTATPSASLDGVAEKHLAP